MSLTIGQANQLFRLLRYLLPSLKRRNRFDAPVSEWEALDAVEQLADAAHKALSAGPTGAEARAALHEDWPAPPKAAKKARS